MCCITIILIKSIVKLKVLKNTLLTLIPGNGAGDTDFGPGTGTGFGFVFDSGSAEDIKQQIL